MEILGKLGINGKILLAQIVNFFLLLYVLKRFLYKPLLDILKKREEKIKETLQNADKAEKNLAKAEEKVKEQLEKANQEADRILEVAHTEGEEHKNDMLRETKDEIIKWKEEAKNQLRQEKNRLSAEVRKETVDLAIGITQKILKEKITATDRKKWIKEIEEEATKSTVE